MTHESWNLAGEKHIDSVKLKTGWYVRHFIGFYQIDETSKVKNSNFWKMSSNQFVELIYPWRFDAVAAEMRRHHSWTRLIRLGLSRICWPDSYLSTHFLIDTNMPSYSNRRCLSEKFNDPDFLLYLQSHVTWNIFQNEITVKHISDIM